MMRNAKKLPEKLQNIYYNLLTAVFILFFSALFFIGHSEMLISLVFFIVLTVIDLFFVFRAEGGKISWLTSDFLLILAYLLVIIWKI